MDVKPEAITKIHLTLNYGVGGRPQSPLPRAPAENVLHIPSLAGLRFLVGPRLVLERNLHFGDGFQ